MRTQGRRVLGSSALAHSGGNVDYVYLTTSPNAVKVANPKQHGVSMHDIAQKRMANRISRAGIAPHLTALMIATGLLVVWAGLCGIM